MFSLDPFWHFSIEEIPGWIFKGNPLKRYYKGKESANVHFQ